MGLSLVLLLIKVVVHKSTSEKVGGRMGLDAGMILPVMIS